MEQSRQEKRLPAWPGADRLIDALDKVITNPRHGPAVLLVVEEPPPGAAGTAFLHGLHARCKGAKGHLAPCVLLTFSAPTPDPHTGTSPGDGVDSVAALADELRRRMPPDAGRLRLPTHELLMDTVRAGELRDVERDRARKLRRHLHRKRRAAVFPDWFSEEVGAAGTSLPARALRLVARAWSSGMGEWWFGFRVNRRLGGRGWFGTWIEKVTGDPDSDFFEAAERLAPGAREPLDRDQALLRALLDDLDTALRRRFLLPARSRRPRFVLLLTADPDDSTGAAAERLRKFLKNLRQAMRALGTRGVVAVAHLPPGIRHEANLPDPLPLGKASEKLVPTGRPDAQPGGKPIEAVIRAPEPGSPAEDGNAEDFLAAQPKLTARSGSRLGPRTSLLLQVGALLAVPALLIGGWAVADLPGDGGGICPEGQWEGAGGLSCIGLSDGTEPFRGLSDEFGPLIELIAENNARAEEYGERGWQVRTVVHLAPYTAAMPGPGVVQDSTLAELHGIALAQRMLLEEVGRDDARDRVALRVLLANAGPRFSEGPRVAGAILEEVDAEGIIGVTGLGQSREDTYRTMDVLDAAGLPMIGTTATADGMLERGAQQYFQLAPTNDRQARVAISFLAHTPLLPASEVETEPDDDATDGADEGTDGSDGDNGVDPDDGVGPGADGDPAADDPPTVPANAAIIVYDELDIYSENLAAAFRDHFHEEIGDRITDVRYRPREDVHGEVEGAYSPDALRSLGEVAEHVCRHMAPERSTVVLWAGREGDLVGFLDDFSRVDGCDSRLTVLGGDAVANALVGEVNPVAKHSGLTLYYLVHAIPGTDPRTERARLFNRTLDAWAEEQRRRGDAPAAAAAEVLESGGAALGWDAMDILATAAGLAHRTEGRTGDFDRSAVSTVLNTGNVNIQGATGLLNFRERRVPVEKPVYVVRAGEREAEIVLSCGRFSAGVEDTVWGPRDVPCPREE
ncbi:hypothetical protein [Streptomyces alkaliphilus]|uniref:hypothetical protein n=1 Tax=Streptomyces alkaliphilus TaxID=1472722 RepID=UPI001180E477|nr:hypothetical protein [Streptomyces alkaliphilus]MQS06282.1 hypothetical protein [Streptomyces alkaliphilus]